MPFGRGLVPAAEACSLRRDDPTPPAPRAGRLSDGALLGAKAGALCLACLVLLPGQLNPDRAGILCSQEAGLSMRVPRGWHRFALPHALAAVKPDGAGGPRASVLLWRPPYAEPGAADGSEDAVVSAGWPRADPAATLAEAADCLGLDWSGQARLETDTIADRPALVLAAPLRASRCWRALAVAAGEDLLFVELDVSSEQDLRAVWRQWKAMLRSVRITGSDRPSVAGGAD